MSQNGPKTTSLMTSLTKNLQPSTKNFFQVQTGRLAKSFESLNSCLVQSAEELWHFSGNCKSADFRLISRHYIFVDWLSNG